MSLYKQFTTDPELEKNGIELEYPNEDGKTSSVFLVARAGGANARYNKVLEAKSKPYRRQIQMETISPETMDQIMREVYAETVVRGWFTVTYDSSHKEVSRSAYIFDAADQSLPFNRDNAIKVFTELPELFTDIQIQAAKAALYKKEELETATGNS